MNSKSPTDVRWSLRIDGDVFNFFIGIASKFEHTTTYIGNYDEYAIIYIPDQGRISHKRNKVHMNTVKVKCGDEIHFRFQPKLKKFSVSVV